MSNTKHTPTPWTAIERKVWIGVRTGRPRVIATCHSVNCGDKIPGFKANAERIVHCVNHFDEMLHALKLAQGYFRDAARTSPQHFAGYFKAVSDAIAKAEGRKP